MLNRITLHKFTEVPAYPSTARYADYAQIDRRLPNEAVLLYELAVHLIGRQLDRGPWTEEEEGLPPAPSFDVLGLDIVAEIEWWKQRREEIDRMRAAAKQPHGQFPTLREIYSDRIGSLGWESELICEPSSAFFRIRIQHFRERPEPVACESLEICLRDWSPFVQLDEEAVVWRGIERDGLGSENTFNCRIPGEWWLTREVEDGQNRFHDWIVPLLQSATKPQRDTVSRVFPTEAQWEAVDSLIGATDEGRRVLRELRQRNEQATERYDDLADEAGGNASWYFRDLMGSPREPLIVIAEAPVGTSSSEWLEEAHLALEPGDIEGFDHGFRVIRVSYPSLLMHNLICQSNDALLPGMVKVCWPKELRDLGARRLTVRPEDIAISADKTGALDWSIYWSEKFSSATRFVSRFWEMKRTERLLALEQEYSLFRLREHGLREEQRVALRAERATWRIEKEREYRALSDHYEDIRGGRRDAYISELFEDLDRLETELDQVQKARLTAEARADALASALARKKIEVDAEPLESAAEQYGGPEIGRWLRELRPSTQGRTMLFMGGKPKPERIAEIEKALGLKELIWPETNDTSDQSVFTYHAKRADIVCFLVRWSRHEYKNVLDDAKADGKLTATFKAGLGLRRIIHDLHEQLVYPM